MRVLAIGLGGAGSRIVDILYDHDRRSRVYCMSVVAIDIDPNSLVQLRHLPEPARIYFPPIDAIDPDDVANVIDIEEVMTRIQSLDTMEIDAILLCCGLGGNVIDIAPAIVEEIRKSYLEPIYALAVLPCLDEGRSVSAKAADDLDGLQELVDAVILFDNETWSKKVRGTAHTEGEEEEGANIVAQIRRRSAYLDPRTRYNMLNENIARQIGLLLRAGEFSEHGVEVAEIVLDAGEVLNTLTGMGFVAVGYATERLPVGWFDFLSRWRSMRYFIEESHERAARIVALAKKAVYEEISVPCDLTSANKALVLIAGPSTELSMKGFQTVRKWIDRSIAGLEMRSGDYPVSSTSFVGIVIVLSGLSNIPRIEEIREIRTDYRLECEEEQLRAEEMKQMHEEGIWAPEERDEDIPYFASPLEAKFLEEISMAEPTKGRDEMIEVPGSSQGGRRGRDETIDILPRAKKEREDKKIHLPPKPGEKEMDLTRSTSVTSSVPAPKNSALGPKNINIEKASPKDDMTTASIPPVQRPKDNTLMGERISLGPEMHPPIDKALDEPDLRIKEVFPEPKDDLLNHRPDRWTSRPKEVDPARGKLKMIDTASKQLKKNEDEDDDQSAGGIAWIT